MARGVLGPDPNEGKNMYDIIVQRIVTEEYRVRVAAIDEDIAKEVVADKLSRTNDAAWHRVTASPPNNVEVINRGPAGGRTGRPEAEAKIT